jgi:ferredoxin
MVKIRIEYHRDKCIGAGVCAAVDPDNFEMGSDGKADLRGAKKEGAVFVKETDVQSIENTKTAAEGCPVLVIKLVDQKTRKKIAGGD